MAVVNVTAIRKIRSSADTNQPMYVGLALEQQRIGMQAHHPAAAVVIIDRVTKSGEAAGQAGHDDRLR